MVCYQGFQARLNAPRLEATLIACSTGYAKPRLVGARLCQLKGQKSLSVFLASPNNKATQNYFSILIH